MTTFFIVLLVVGLLIFCFGFHSPLRRYWLSSGTLLMLGGMFAGIGINPSRDAPNGSVAMVVLGVVLIICAIPIFIIGFKKDDEHSKNVMNAVKLAAYDEQHHTLTLKARDHSLSSMLSMRKHQVMEISTKPEEYVYRSVTVGAVTTGGVEKRGGYDYISNVQNSGNYELNYNGKTVFTIQLAPGLAEQARRSRVAAYMEGSKIVVVDPKKYTKSPLGQKELATLMRTNYNAYASHAAKLMAPGFPDYEKCNTILNWVLGN